MTPLPGLAIGHATDQDLKSGVTVFLPDQPSVAAVHVSGGAPATRETDLLEPGNLVEHVDAIVLSGGSAYGLAATDGVVSWLAQQGRGYKIGGTIVPIVPGAALFDLANGGKKPEPAALGAHYAALGRTACESSGGAAGIGSVGAGTGATTADLKGGFGAAETELPGGIRLAAYAAVNPVGQTTIAGLPFFRAAPFEKEAEFGGLGLPSPVPADAVVLKGRADPRSATTLAVIVTSCELTPSQGRRLAICAHDGISLAVYPAHTLFDGDAVFVLSTGAVPLPDAETLVRLGAAAVATLARAIAVGVYAAEPAPGDRLPTWRQRYSRR